MATDHNPALSPRLPARPRVAQARARARSAAVAASLALLSLLALAACTSSTDQAKPPTPTIESLTELPPPPPFDKEQADKDIKKVYEKYLQALVDIQTKDYETQKTFLHPYGTEKFNNDHLVSPTSYGSSKYQRLDKPLVTYKQKNISKVEADYLTCLNFENALYEEKETGAVGKRPNAGKQAFKLAWSFDTYKGWLLNSENFFNKDDKTGTYEEACK